MSLKTHSKIESAALLQVRIIQTAVQNSSYAPNPQKSSFYHLPTNLKAFIAEKRIVRCGWLGTRLPCDKHTLNNLANII